MLMFEALKSFGLLDTVDKVNKRGKGTVNRTYIVLENGNEYALQLIDFNVFKKVKWVVKNVEMVTKHLRKVKGDYDVCALYGKDNSEHVLVGVSYWRCYKLRENEIIIHKFDNDKIYYEFGKVLGKFHRQTVDFPVEKLRITIPNYQNTYNYYKEFIKANNECKTDKTLFTWNEYKFITDREHLFSLIDNLLKEGKVPKRVVHNNVRKANVIFDKNSYKALYLIGMDAVMPGSLLRDFGETVRYVFSSRKEIDPNLDIEFFISDKFKHGLKGYLIEVKDIITQIELDYLIDSIKVMALEYGTRHLIDYLLDGKNFNHMFDNENLDICKNQFKLVQDIETHYDELKIIVQEVANEIMKTK